MIILLDCLKWFFSWYRLNSLIEEIKTHYTWFNIYCHQILMILVCCFTVSVIDYEMCCRMMNKTVLWTVMQLQSFPTSIWRSFSNWEIQIRLVLEERILVITQVVLSEFLWLIWIQTRWLTTVCLWHKDWLFL